MSNKPVVPRNTLQQRLLEYENLGLRPDPSTINRSPCRVLEVFDQESIDGENLDPQIENTLKEFPGRVFARVAVRGGKTLVVPFEKPEHELYTLYGNSTQLQGQAAYLEYRGVFIDEGHIVLQPDARRKLLNVGEASKSYDIGGLYNA